MRFKITCIYNRSPQNMVITLNYHPCLVLICLVSFFISFHQNKYESIIINQLLPEWNFQAAITKELSVYYEKKNDYISRSDISRLCLHVERAPRNSIMWQHTICILIFKSIQMYLMLNGFRLFNNTFWKKKSFRNKRYSFR